MAQCFGYAGDIGPAGDCYAGEGVAELVGMKIGHFQLLYVHCYDRQVTMSIKNDRGNLEDQQMLDELRRFEEK